MARQAGEWLRKDDEGWECYVMCEVLVPDLPNVYGDIYTAPAIREFALQFALQGYGIDVEHDKQDVTGQSAVVVESFIVRPGDPDFIEGAWVIGMKILDPALWLDILEGRINGYSYEATCEVLPVLIENLRNRTVSGVTEPDPFDGHTHAYTVVLDALNNPISGGTSETDGHSHTISTHTYTGSANAHRHRYQVITHKQEEVDEEGY